MGPIEAAQVQAQRESLENCVETANCLAPGLSSISADESDEGDYDSSLTPAHHRNMVASDRLLAALFVHHRDHALNVLKGIQPRAWDTDFLPPPPPAAPLVVRIEQVPAAAPVPSEVRSPPVVPIKVKLAEMLEEIADKHGVTVMDLESDSRNIELVQARHEYFYEALTRTAHGCKAIGRVCGDRDHSTVLYGAARYAHQHKLPPPRGKQMTESQKRRFGIKEEAA